MSMTMVYVLFFFTTTIVISFLFRYKLIKQNIFLFLLVFDLFICESVLLVTATLGIRNHAIANINTLIYCSLSIFVLFRIWESIKGKTHLLKCTKLTILIIIFLGWGFENFLFENIYLYNSFLAGIISFLLVILCIYLVNAMIFIKNNRILKDSNGLVLIGVLIRSFFGGLILLFLNYRMKFSNEFYVNMTIIGNLASIISNIFFLSAVICLPKKMKHTWPF